MPRRDVAQQEYLQGIIDMRGTCNVHCMSRIEQSIANYSPVPADEAQSIYSIGISYATILLRTCNASSRISKASL